jgi:hypothetical protein
MVAVVALFVGTSQGALQLVPGVKAWLVAAGEAGDAVANAHAQLNMLGGVLPALVGLFIALRPGFTGRDLLTPAIGRQAALTTGLGAGLYYAAAVAAAVVAGRTVQGESGHVHGALAHAPWWSNVGMAAGSLLLAGAAIVVLRAMWLRSQGARVQMKSTLRHHLTARGPARGWRTQVPSWRYLVPEALGAATGFPGIGWLLSGRPGIGLPLALAGPGIAWAAIPSLVSPHGDAPWAGLGLRAVPAYLVASSVASVVGLALATRPGHEPAT